jgi:Flp pilus assembly protein TadD
MGFMTTGGLEIKDKYFAEAKRLVDRAAELSSGNSEITALKGFVLMGELSADPQSRGADMGAITLQTLEKAAALGPNNPRALILLAQMEYGTSQFFGQSTEKACKLAKRSSELFNQEKAKNRDHTLEPRWGKEMIEQLVDACENVP